jgi:hypothetical protein
VTKECVHEWGQLGHWSDGLWQCRLCRKEIGVLRGARTTGRKVVISPNVNQPWGGKEGVIIGSNLTGIIVHLNDGIEEDFSTTALYEFRQRRRSP